VACLGLLTGCARTVTVPDPAPSGRTAEICSALLADLPAAVLGQDRREVTPGRYSAAWGDPTITLRCGVTKPPRLGPASACYEVNGVGWFSENGTGGLIFTTIGRPAYVEVAVPSAYAPEANALVDLAAVVSRHDPVQQPCL
jgi:hypothetical protein